MGKRYSKETRDEVLGKIRSGQKVSEVAKAHGINEMTLAWCGSLSSALLREPEQCPRGSIPTRGLSTHPRSSCRGSSRLESPSR